MRIQYLHILGREGFFLQFIEVNVHALCLAIIFHLDCV